MKKSQKELESLEEYQQRVLKEEERDAWGQLNNSRKLRFVSFVSTSNGKDRSKRKPREVNLLIDHNVVYGKVAYQVRHGEIRPRRNNSGLSPDELAREVLTNLPDDERTVDTLLQRILDRVRKIPLYK
jgi:hypothetical protein